MGNSKIVYYGETLIDLTGDTVEAAKLLKGVTAHDKKGEKITGTLSDVTQATPAITVDAAGKITASATQAAGVVAAGTKSATKQLPVQAAKTVTPSASAQTAVGKGVFTTGIITVAAVYAVIGVTYPSGSTVTCTNGSKTLKAKDTTGKAMFIIPTKGTWTVKAVKGSQSASKAVSITAEGQVETVELSYSTDFVIYSEEKAVWKNGYSLITLDSAKDGSHADVIPPYVGSESEYKIGARLNKILDLTEYKTLQITCSLTGNSTQWETAVGLVPENSTYAANNWIDSPGTEGMNAYFTSHNFAKKTKMIDISKLSGNYWLKWNWYASDLPSKFIIYDMRLKK